MTATIAEAVAAMGDGPLHEEGVARWLRPLFSRALARREIYVANHSLGRPLDQTARDVQRAVDLWYTEMDGAWAEWMAESEAFCERTAALIGLRERDRAGRPCVVPKPGAGQGLRAVLNAITAPTARVVATRGEFDSIDFILKTYADRGRARVRWVEAESDGLFRAERIVEAIDGAVDLVVVSQVFFASGQELVGLEEIVHRAHEVGALVMVDMYHAEGVLPGRMSELGADFAIGGSYKYTRGGPGAGWLAVHPRHLGSMGDERLVTLDTGWFAKDDVFGYARTERAAEQLAGGIHAWMECTPPVLTAYQAKAGLEFTLAVGVERLRRYNVELQEFFVACAREQGVRLREIWPRGAFVLVPHERAGEKCGELRAAGVNVDARTTANGERCVRVCPDVLTTREELRRAAEIIADVWRR